MDRDEAAALLDLIIERAPSLRAVGVLVVNLGVAGFQLAPAELAPAEPTESEDKGEPPRTALHDPWTHGQPVDGSPRAITVKRTPL